MMYPVVTYGIRSFHEVGFGKLLHTVAKKTGLITNPIISPTKRVTQLPGAYTALVLEQLTGLTTQIFHRRVIATVYYESLKEYSLVNQSDIKHGACLRFPIKVKNPQRLITALQHHHVYIADRWYRKPVDCGSATCQTAYVTGSCPNAEELSKHIVNLPTHRYISVHDAHQIGELVKKYI